MTGLNKLALSRTWETPDDIMGSFVIGSDYCSASDSSRERGREEGRLTPLLGFHDT